jgi:hypothetical protein
MPYNDLSWKRWFAWLPVVLLDGGWTWLRYVERNDDVDGGEPIYRLPARGPDAG